EETGRRVCQTAKMEKSATFARGASSPSGPKKLHSINGPTKDMSFVASMSLWASVIGAGRGIGMTRPKRRSKRLSAGSTRSCPDARRHEIFRHAENSDPAAELSAGRRVRQQSPRRRNIWLEHRPGGVRGQHDDGRP